MTDLRPLRQQMMRIASAAGEGHLPSSYSVLDMIWVLHQDVMQADDKFILSKGHAALALYAVLAERGMMQWNTIKGHFGYSHLPGHPERNPAAGIEATTGSLGHGFPMAVGLAYAKRLSGYCGRVFCIAGDSEMEEGSCWEAAHLAARHRLSNLTLLVDANGNSPNRIDGIRLHTSLCEKFNAFGWFVSRINGHDHNAIRRVCAATGGDRPFVIVCDTVKGYGVPEFECCPAEWHHKVPTAEQLPELLESVR